MSSAPPDIAVASLADDLHRLGVDHGDLVMVHASLRALGQVDGGAAGVVAALDASVGAGGTVLMNIGARDDWDWVNGHPEPERAALLAGAPAFDYRVTPADPDVGVLAEIFRQTPGTLASNHPDGRFAARGRLAEWLVADVPWDDYYGPRSTLHRLVEAHGKVLRLGADPNTVTLTHYAEYLADVSHKRRVRRHHQVTGPHGPEIRVVESLDDTDGIVDYPGGDYFGVILAAYLASGAGRVGLVGTASSELLDAGDFVDFAARWMTDQLVRRLEEDRR